MTRQRVLSAAVLWALMLFAGPVLANYLAGETVIVSEPISEDFYLAGNHVDLRAPVQGDLVARQALRRTGKAEGAPWYVSAVALGLQVLIPLLPFGGLVVLVLFLFAFGAVTLQAWETRH